MHFEHEIYCFSQRSMSLHQNRVRCTFPPDGRIPMVICSTVEGLRVIDLSISQQVPQPALLGKPWRTNRD